MARYTCFVYGQDGLFGAYEVSGTPREARTKCKAAFVAEPVGRDVKPRRPKLVLKKR